ncbi:MAG: hypothetical protein ACR5K7_02625 [Symbiopectobacterium sp.]
MNRTYNNVALSFLPPSDVRDRFSTPWMMVPPVNVTNQILKGKLDTLQTQMLAHKAAQGYDYCFHRYYIRLLLKTA